jgi:hypothetical protein
MANDDENNSGGAVAGTLSGIFGLVILVCSLMFWYNRHRNPKTFAAWFRGFLSFFPALIASPVYLTYATIRCTVGEWKFGRDGLEFLNTSCFPPKVEVKPGDQAMAALTTAT